VDQRPAPGYHVDDDDLPVGRMLSRREALVLLGGVSASVAVVALAPAVLAQSPGASPSAGVAASALPACVIRPELTEGPYYVADELERSDIRVDSADGSQVPGARLDLTWLVSKVDGTGCVPLEGAVVDVWHCDASGVYSGVTDPSFDTTGHDFLRGVQRTDATGAATFTTIYPGWYQGRTVHVHFKVRTDPDQSTGTELTSQLFFDDTFTDTVFLAEPYASTGIRTLRNDGDGIYRQSGGQTLVAVTPTADGYAGTFAIGVQLA
jgi:protocatechuate 3,4-dioxygenase beta subunit